jgi:hypothetical protein
MRFDAFLKMGNKYFASGRDVLFSYRWVVEINHFVLFTCVYTMYTYAVNMRNVQQNFTKHR